MAFIDAGTYAEIAAKRAYKQAELDNRITWLMGAISRWDDFQRLGRLLEALQVEGWRLYPSPQNGGLTLDDGKGTSYDGRVLAHRLLTIMQEQERKTA